MTKEEVEYEILKIFTSKINFTFESYDDLWDKYHKKLLCTRDIFNEILNEFHSSGYLDYNYNRNLIPTTKSKTAYINHHIGRYNERQQRNKELEKTIQELKALRYTNSKGYKTLSLGGMIIGIIGGVFGIMSYYKTDDKTITVDKIKFYVDSLRQEDLSNTLNQKSLKHLKHNKLNDK